jgi:hypothetical protein
VPNQKSYDSFYAPKPISPDESSSNESGMEEDDDDDDEEEDPH